MNIINQRNLLLQKMLYKYLQLNINILIIILNF